MIYEVWFQDLSENCGESSGKKEFLKKIFENSPVISLPGASRWSHVLITHVSCWSLSIVLLSSCSLLLDRPFGPWQRPVFRWTTNAFCSQALDAVIVLQTIVALCPARVSMLPARRRLLHCTCQALPGPTLHIVFMKCYDAFYSSQHVATCDIKLYIMPYVYLIYPNSTVLVWACIILL